MQAILIESQGGVEVLKLAERPKPELPGPHHLLVKLHAAGVNPLDTKLRKHNAYYPGRFPVILGCDGAGTVEAVGPAVTHFKAGDAVFFFQGGIGGEQGNYAQYNTIHEDYATLKPDELGFHQAAVLPLVLITAWEALFERGHLQRGQKALIHGAAGGVGHIALQLAKSADAQVAVTVGSQEKADFARGLGADLIIDYTREDFATAVLAWTQNTGVDLALDLVGGETFCRSFAATRIYGQVVSILQTACDAKDMGVARRRNLTLGYELMLTPMFLGLHEERVRQRKILEEGARLIQAKKLRVAVSHVLPLKEVATAHQLIETGHTLGKIVLSIC
jgi:NADPH2:quinone reductase